MYKTVLSKEYEKGYVRAIKRGFNISQLNVIVNILIAGKKLPNICRDHKLRGKYDGYRECHIAFDWLLIYQIDKTKNILYLIRTGTHDDLFGI